MPRYSKTLTAAAQAAFLAALQGGAKVVEAAAAAGVGVSGLYCRRRRDPAFDWAWSEAAATSWHEEWREPPAGGPPVLVRTARRGRFSAEMKAEFLGLLEKSCNTRESAREAAVHPSTVYRHLKRDPEFASANAAALKRGYAALERESAEARAAMEARIASGELGWEIVPRGRITSDFDRQMLLLARYDRKDGSLGRRTVRHGHMRSASFEEAIVLLDRRLRWMGARPGG
jgi:hypothetical protein